MSIVSLVRFSRPWFLAAIAAAGVPLLLAFWAGRRGRHVGALSVALECLAIALAALALAAPAVPLGGKSQKPYIVLRDVSGSVRGQPETPRTYWPDDLPRERYDFAAMVVAADAGKPPRADYTNPAGPLRLAAARANELAGVVILTDGQFHDATWQAAAEGLGRTGLDVAIVAMDSPPADVRIADFAAERRADGRVELRVTVASNALAKRTLAVRRRSGPAANALLLRPLNLMAGESETIRLTDSPPPGRAAAYRAELSGDEFPENDAADAMALPADQRVGLVAADAAGVPAAGLAAALKLAVAEIPPPAAPRGAAGWTDYAAVVLVDAEGRLLAKPQRSALAEYVRSGGGLVLIGAGPHRTPADRADPLNRIAPLVANPYERKAMKVVVVLDASGSMGGPTEVEGAGSRRIKFDMAREAVMALQRHLARRDALAVITFCYSARTVYDSGAGRPDFAAVRDALAGVRPAGPTHLNEALIQAVKVPLPAGREGLVLLLSDLIPTKPIDPVAAAQRFRRSGYQLAIVATGRPGQTQPAEAPLVALAEELNARLERRDHLAGLAKVFADFLTEFRGSAVRRGTFKVTVERSLFGRGRAPWPDLDAYILSAAHPEAVRLAGAGPESDPLIAWRRAGLGRSAAFALPAGPASNAALKGWSGFNDVLAAAVRWAMRPQGDGRFAGRAYRSAGKLHVRLDARDAGGPVNLLELTAEVVVPGGPAVRRADLAQTAPGRYEAQIDAADGSAAVVVREAGGRTVWQGRVGPAGGREFAAIGADWQKLRQLAELTGGRLLKRRRLRGLGRELNLRRYRPVWMILLAAATALMLLEWSGTRIWRRER